MSQTKPILTRSILIFWVLVSILVSELIILEDLTNSRDQVIEPEHIFTVDQPFYISPTPPLQGKDEINAYAETISNFYGLDPYIIKAMIYQESRYDPKAYNEASNATGLMQVVPKWHKDRMNRLEVYSLFDPYGNILVGCDYLKELLDRTGDIRLALMMYNMDHSSARSLYNKGIVSQYAKDILKRAEQLRTGGVGDA